MNEHLTEHAAKWFASIDSWQSFVDLIPLKDDIENVWLGQATEDLRLHFRQNPCKGWSFREWGANHDTWWFLEEFGHESVGIGFGWRYHFCLGVAFGGRIDRTRLTLALQQDAYAELRRAFGRIDNTRWKGCEYEQYGYFNFDGKERLKPYELAWYAGFQRQEFVRQAAAKIEVFAAAEITAILRDLNNELMT